MNVQTFNIEMNIMCNFDLITGAISRSTPKRRLPADVSIIVNSPSTYSTNSTFRGSSTTVLTPGTPRLKPESRPATERMQHKIPHRFVTGLNSRATKCAVCLGTVPFVKLAAKCAGEILCCE